MAISRGGGFSGGGGRSFSSSSSRGSSGPSFATRPFAGATAYFYISHSGRRCEFYSTKEPKRESCTKAIAMAVLCFAIAVIFFALFLYSSFPTKLSSSLCQETGVYIVDGADILENEEKLNGEFKAFYEKTGIEPCVLTITEADFPKTVYGEADAESLINFAYDEYYMRYTDEGHYLITVLKLQDGDYLWCEMAGDDTVSLIDDDAFRCMQAYMIELKPKNDAATVIGDAFTKLSSDVFQITSSDKFALIMISVAAIAVVAVIIINLISSLKRIKIINGYCDYKETAAAHTERRYENEFKNF